VPGDYYQQQQHVNGSVSPGAEFNEDENNNHNNKKNKNAKLKSLRDGADGYKTQTTTTDIQFSYSNVNFNSMPITPNCLLGSFEVVREANVELMLETNSFSFKIFYKNPRNLYSTDE
jgi:hypothetical protein